MGRALRRLLVRTIRFFLVRPPALFGAAVVVVAVVATALVLSIAAGGRLGLPNVGTPLARSEGEPGATEAYLRGNREYNAQLIWDSLSEEARQRLLSQGGSFDAIALQVQAARQGGIRLEEATYIGGRILPDGTSVQFYLVAVRPQPQADVAYVPYTFTLDRAGKIEKIQ